MTLPNKILIVSIGCLTTLLIFVEAGHHGGGSDIATLIAAGLITLMLKEGSSAKSLARHAHGFMLPPAHGLSLGSFAYPRSIGGFGIHAFNFAPMFGGLRYHLAGMDHFPLPGADLPKGMGLHLPFGRNFGLYPPLPNMFGNNKQDINENNHFDIVRNIIQRERENVAPPNTEQHNGQHFNPENRDFFNFDQENKPPVEPRRQMIN